PKEQCANFDDRGKMKMIGAVDCARRGIPREPRHRDHDGFLNPPRPTKAPAEHRSAHYPEQIDKIALTLYPDRVPRLRDFGKGRVSNIDAPVVPMTFERSAPNARNMALTRGVPANSPLI